MKYLNMQMLLVGLALATSLGARAENFSDCLSNRRGTIALVVDDSRFESASEVFELFNDLEYSGFQLQRVLGGSDLIYSPTGAPQLDSQGSPLSVNIQRITAKVNGRVSDFIDQNGTINTDLADKYDESILKLKESYPAILRTECELLPGPGGRVGG